MKASRLNLFVSGISLAVSLAGQVAFAGETAPADKDAGKPAASTPSAKDLQNSRDRGLIFNTIVAPAATTQPPAVKVPLVRTVATPAKTSKASTAKLPVKQSGGHKTANAAAPKTKTPSTPKVTYPATAATATESNVVTVSHQVVTGGTNVVKAWLNKAGNEPVYKVGEKMSVSVSASQDCNLVVFDFDGKSNLKQIFPNEYQPNGQVKAGETVNIGGAESPFDFQVGGSGGSERIFVYAYPTTASASPLTVAMLATPHSPFRSAEMTLEKYRDLVNKSKVFFSREVKIVPKQGVQPVSDTSGAAPNKVELSFKVQPQ